MKDLKKDTHSTLIRTLKKLKTPRSIVAFRFSTNKNPKPLKTTEKESKHLNPNIQKRGDWNVKISITIITFNSTSFE